MNTEDKRNKEKLVVDKMIRIYCRGHHGKQLCEKCQGLMEYAHKRIELCPFMENKTFCSSCTVHCYQRERREEIKKVMRYSGPRMIFHHPVLAISHLIEERKNACDKQKTA